MDCSPALTAAVNAKVTEFKEYDRLWGASGGAPALLFSKLLFCGAIACFAAAALFAATHVHASSLFVSSFLLFVTADLHSGLAHIVLDDPRSFELFAPLQAGCVEFLAHHIFPRDLAVRNVATIMSAGVVDAGPPVVLVAGVACIALRYLGYDERFSALLAFCVASKLCLIMLGQYAHVCAHRRVADLPPVAKLLQRAGVLISASHHRTHHRGKHDCNFCVLSGWCDGVVTWVHRHVKSCEGRVLLVALVLLDTPIVAWLACG